MAEAQEPKGGGEDGLGAAIIIILIICLIAAWLRGGGWNRLITQPINFGWQYATSTSAIVPFAPDFTNLAPHVPIPTGPTGPASPDPYNR